MSYIKPSQFEISGRPVGTEHSPYCIAEVGINHNGRIDVAKEMIRVAKLAGADAVKFQTFKAEEFCGDPTQKFTYLSQGHSVTESMLDMFRRYEFTAEQWHELKSVCDEVGITFFSTPQNTSDFELLKTLNVPAVKIGSDDFTNLPLIREYSVSGLPLLLSCGMSDLAEVHSALETAGWFKGQKVALFLCTSQYPTPPVDANVRKLTTLQNAFPGLTVGLSDHTQGPLAAGLAVALGASIFEKHFTLDKNLPGPDHWFSEDEIGLREWITTIRTAHQMLGSPYIQPTKAELDMRLLARRSVIAIKDISVGEAFNANNIGLRRPGGGLPPTMLEQIIGLTAGRAILTGTRIELKDL